MADIRKMADGTKYTRVSAHFDQMSWPRIDGADDDNDDSLEHRLRYGVVISPSDVLHAAEYVAAYGALVRATEAKRRHVVRVLRAVEADDEARRGVPKRAQ